MVDFKFPDIGEGITEGTLLEWFVKKGDTVKEGDSLFLVETDKVTAEIPSPVSGEIAECYGNEGDIIYVGNVVVRIKESNEASKAGIKEDRKSKNEEATAEETAGVVGEIIASSEVIESSSENIQANEEAKIQKILSTPAARAIAKDLGVDIQKIIGTGPSGRVMKEDIYKASTKNEKREQILKVQPEKTERKMLDALDAEERVPLTRIRKTIAKNMVLSRSIIPYAASIDDFDVTDLVALRESQKEKAAEMKIALTYMPFIIKAAALSLKRSPRINAAYDEEKEELILKKYYNIGIAVDTPEGLMVPVIKDVDKKGIMNIAEELKILSEEARNRTISLEKMQEGTFSITNYGATGSIYAVPIIRYPEAAILGVGKITKKPVVIADEILIRDILPISFAFDHRIIDGADAGRFLNILKDYLSDPMLLLLS